MFGRIRLPRGYSVKKNRFVGFDFFGVDGTIMVQYPFDNDYIRQAIIYMDWLERWNKTVRKKLVG